MSPSEDDPREAARARALLIRPTAWLDEAPGAYLVRLGPDRRRRPALRIGESAFRALVAEPGLSPRAEGGWRALPARPSAAPPPPPPGRPGVIAGERLVFDPDGRPVRRAANLGESPIMWLLRRRWLTPAEAAAGERLRAEVQAAGMLGRLTMSWDAGPRAAGGRAPGLDPSERRRAAKERLAAALASVEPRLRAVLEQVCVRDSTLDAVERGLGVRRREGKAVLKAALGQLARHYGVG